MAPVPPGFARAGGCGRKKACGETTIQTPADSSTARSGWPLFASAALLLTAGLLIHRHFFHDDAYVSLRYAERWLAGKGLTWNDGERVEGFSSPAWLAQLALLARLGVDLPLAARGLGLAYALAILVLWHRARVEPAGLLALVTVPGFAMWTWGGLETISAGFWMLLAMVLLWRRRERPWALSSKLLAALSLTFVALGRPEGIVVALAVLGGAWPDRRSPRLALAAGLGVVFAGYEAFRLLYFGDFIANAARAKTLGLPIGARLEDAAIYLVKTAPQWLGAVLVAAWLFATSPLRRRAAWMLLPLLPLLAVVFAGGGDHMPGARLLLAPVAALCLAASLAPPSPRRAARRITLWLAALAALWQLQLTWRHPAALNPAAAVGESVGRGLAARFAPGTVVASATAGSLPYFAPALSFIDTLGLNDRHIARETPATLPRALADTDNWVGVPGHSRGDGAYVLARRPDIVILGGANGDLAPWFLGDYQLLLAKGFQMSYAPWRLLVEVPPSARPWVEDELDAASGRLRVTLYVRRDSPAWAVVAAQATPLPPPWSQP